MIIDNYLALPGSGSGPGVLVLHEAWGLTHDIRWAADRLSEMGYVALAPDLTPYMRGVAGGVAQLLAGRGPLVEAALSAVDSLTARRQVHEGGVGVVGFSMGAGLALLLDRHPRVSVLGVNYGMVPRGALSSRPVPVVGSYGADDRLLPGDGRALRRSVRKHRDQCDILTYGGVGHSFMTPIGSRSMSTMGAILGLGYRSLAANHAWHRLERFFANHLEQDQRMPLAG